MKVAPLYSQYWNKNKQNDSELWYLIDNSLMNTIPDAWSIFEKFILLPVNKWDNEYSRVSIGGISCDHSDYYNSEDLNQEIFLPTYESDKRSRFILDFSIQAHIKTQYQDMVVSSTAKSHCPNKSL